MTKQVFKMEKQEVILTAVQSCLNGLESVGICGGCFVTSPYTHIHTHTHTNIQKLTCDTRTETYKHTQTQCVIALGQELF